MHHSITYPCGIVKDLLVKVGKNFSGRFFALDMKDNEGLPIVFARPFLSTDSALVDIYDSNLSHRVEDEEITFRVNIKAKHQQ